MRNKFRFGRLVFIILIYLMVVIGCEKKQNEKENNTNTVINNPGQKVSAEEEDQSNLDVIFVMDKSGSMKKSDKNRIAVTGAKMFLDMMMNKGSHVANVDFSDKASSSDLVTIKNEKDKDYLKQYLDNIKYGSGVTDYGLALKKAVSLLDKANGNNKKNILFFTDGNLFTGDQRKLSEAKKDVKNAIDEAVEKGYKIYCMGLNNNGKVDKVELSKISSETNGKYYIINDASELLHTFNSIFKDMGGINIVKPQIIDDETISFKVDSEYVVEANINMLSNSKLSDFKLRNPKGKEVNLKGDDYIFNSDKKYSVLKIMKPAKGTWELSVKGVKIKKIKPKLVYIYDLSIQADADVDKTQKGGIITISSSLVKNNGERIIGKSFYKDLAAVAKVKLIQDKKETSFDNIKMKAEKDGFTADMKMKEIGDYEITVHIAKGKKWYRDSKVMTVSANKLPVEQVKELSEIILKKGTTKKVELLDYFNDPEGEKLIFAMSINGKDNKKIQVDLEDSILLICAKDIGSEKIDIAVSNGYGEEKMVTIKIKGETFISRYGFIVLVTAVIIIIILIIVLFAHTNRQIRGNVKLSLVYNERNNETGTIETKEYDINDDIRLSPLGKHGFTAYCLLKWFGNFYRGSVLNNNNYDVIEKQAADKLKQVSFKPGRKGHSLIMKKKGCNEIVFLGKNYEDISTNTSTISVKSDREIKFGINIKLSEDSSLKMKAVYKV